MLVARRAAARSGRGRAAPADAATISSSSRQVRSLVLGQLRARGSRAARRARARPRARAPRASCRSPSTRVSPAEREQPQRAVVRRAGRRCGSARRRSRGRSRAPSGVVERERAAADAEDDVASGVASRSARPAFQCVYQSSERDPQRLRERRRRAATKSGTMCDEDGVRPRLPWRSSAASARSNRSLAPGAMPRRRSANAHVRGQLVPARRESQITTTSSQRRASARDDVDRLRERGVVGVDGLGDEDEPHGQRASRATVTLDERRASRRRSCSRRRVPVGVARSCAAAPSRAASSRSREHALERGDERDRCRPAGRACPRPRRRRGRGCRPPPSRRPPRPRANASMITRPRPSGHDGSTSTVAASSCSATLRGSSHSWCSTRPGKSRTQLVDDGVLRAAADDHEPRRRAADRATHAARQRASPSTFLYASSTPTKSTVGPLGKRRDGLARRTPRGRCTS